MNWSSIFFNLTEFQILFNYLSYFPVPTFLNLFGLFNQQCCIVLYCTVWFSFVFYCVLLCCVVLCYVCCIMWCFVVLNWVAMVCFMFLCVVFCCFVLFCVLMWIIVLCCSSWFWKILPCALFHCAVLHCVVLCCVVLCYSVCLLTWVSGGSSLEGRVAEGRGRDWVRSGDTQSQSVLLGRDWVSSGELVVNQC